MHAHYRGVGEHCRMCGSKENRTIDALYYSPDFFLGKDEHIRICEDCIKKMQAVIDEARQKHPND